MSDARTRWILELVDRFSGPAKKISELGTAGANRIASLNNHIEKLETRAGSLNKQLFKLGAGVAVFGALSYQSLQFEQGMAKVNTMARVGADELANYGNKIRDISERVPIARDQLQDGLFATISADVPKDNWMQFLEDSAKASIGGIAELGTVVDATAAMVKNYNAEWDTATQIQDQFQRTLQLGQIKNLEDLASALPRVAGQAARLGVAQDELLASFATMVKVTGDSPAQVSTQMAAFMNAIAAPASNAVKMAKDVGIQWDAAAIQAAGGFENFFDQIRPQIIEFSEKNGILVDEIVNTLIGSAEGTKIGMTMMGEGAAVFSKNADEIRNAAGTVDQAFGEMSETSLAQIQMMRSAWQNGMDHIVAVITPFLIVTLKGVSAIFKLGRTFMEAFPNVTKFVVILGVLTTTLYGASLIIALVSLRLQIWHAQLIKAAMAKTGFTAVVAKGTLFMWGFARSLLAGIGRLGRYAFALGVTAVKSIGLFIFSMISATAAQLGFNVAMWANPVGVVIAGIVGLVAVIAGLIVVVKNIIKRWDEWGAGITLLLGPLGLVINMVMSFRRHWDMIKSAFTDGGMIEGIKAIGKVLLDGILYPVQQLLELLSNIPGMGGLAEQGSEAIDRLRQRLLPESEQVQRSSMNLLPGVNLSEQPKEPSKSWLESMFPGSKDDLKKLLEDEDFDFSSTATRGGGEAAERERSELIGSGVSGAGKSITMSLDIVNNFMVSGEQDIEEIAEKIVGKINDRLRDATVALG